MSVCARASGLHSSVRSLLVLALGSTIAITGEGMPLFRNPRRKGNLIITLEVVFPQPESITPAVAEVR